MHSSRSVSATMETSFGLSNTRYNQQGHTFNAGVIGSPHPHSRPIQSYASTTNQQIKVTPNVRPLFSDSKRDITPVTKEKNSQETDTKWGIASSEREFSEEDRPCKRAIFVGCYDAKHNSGSPTFVIIDPQARDRSPKNGAAVPNSIDAGTLAPAKMLFHSADEFTQHLHKSLRDYDDAQLQMWQASFLETCDGDDDTGASSMGHDTDTAFGKAGPLDENPLGAPAQGPGLGCEYDDDEADLQHSAAWSCGAAGDSSSAPVREQAQATQQDPRINTRAFPKALIEEQLRKSHDHETPRAPDVKLEQTPQQDQRVRTHAFPENIFAGLDDVDGGELEITAADAQDLDIDICEDLELRMRRASVEDNIIDVGPESEGAASKRSRSPRDRDRDRQSKKLNKRSMSEYLGGAVSALRKRASVGTGREDSEAQPAHQTPPRASALLPNQRAYMERHGKDTAVDADVSAETSSSAPARFRSPPTPGPQSKEQLHFNAMWQGRGVELSVTPSGLLVCESARPLDPAAETFYHYTTIPSWRVVRTCDGSKRGVAIGLALTLDDGSEAVFSTGEGKEIGQAMMSNVQGLASIMHGGMHVRGSAMVN